jgi:hypothetical protein
MGKKTMAVAGQGREESKKTEWGWAGGVAPLVLEAD